MNKTARKPYTTDEIKTILDMYNAGYKYKEISRKTGRSTAALSQLVYMEKKNSHYSNFIFSANKKKAELKVGGVKVAEVLAEAVEQPKATGVIASGPNTGMPVLEMTPREMIKKLYDLGYRIENNRLVCYVKQSVNLKDIINE